MNSLTDVIERFFCKGRPGERCLECAHAQGIDEFWVRCTAKKSKLPHHPNYVCSRFKKLKNDSIGILNLKTR